MLPQRPKAVVTGAASGLGRAIAQRLAARGGHMVLADVDMAGLEETKLLVEHDGGRVKTVRCDVAKAPEVEALRDAAVAELGAVDLVVNNAGVAVGGKVGEIPLADWEWIVGINLWGVIYGCHYFIPVMKEKKRGHILNVASIAGFAQSPEMGPYNVTKAGVISLTETLAAELAPEGIGATVLCPYFFKTNIAKSARSHTTERDAQAMIEKLMEKTGVQASGVAEHALRACEKNTLYAFPHVQARAIALAKRSIPSIFHQVVVGRMAGSRLRQG
jgi:NAD(P)-dependent dehydrogenase (short-subunit alcohol dehydrogenase family)